MIGSHDTVSRMNKFKQPSYSSKADTESALRSNDPKRAANAIIAAALGEPDRTWVEARCADLIAGGDLEARRAALVAAGHLARIHRTLAPSLVAQIEGLKKDRQLCGSAEDALDDIRQFVRTA